MIDYSNNETWGSRVKKDVGGDEKHSVKFFWPNYDWWTHIYCIKTVAPHAPSYINDCLSAQDTSFADPSL